MVRYYRNGWPARLAVFPFHRNSDPQLGASAQLHVSASGGGTNLWKWTWLGDSQNERRISEPLLEWERVEVKARFGWSFRSLFVPSVGGLSAQQTTGWRSFAFPLFWVFFFCAFCFILSAFLISFTLPPETKALVVVVSILIRSAKQTKNRSQEYFLAMTTLFSG